VGKVFDVVFDLSKENPSFSHWVSFEFKAANKRELFIPETVEKTTK
jgi:dTDP-4-dehydrorhamnose 3,5-epimerase-like enzyme